MAAVPVQSISMPPHLVPIQTGLYGSNSILFEGQVEEITLEGPLELHRFCVFNDHGQMSAPEHLAQQSLHACGTIAGAAGDRWVLVGPILQYTLHYPNDDTDSPQVVIHTESNSYFLPFGANDAHYDTHWEPFMKKVNLAYYFIRAANDYSLLMDHMGPAPEAASLIFQASCGPMFAMKTWLQQSGFCEEDVCEHWQFATHQLQAAAAHHFQHQVNAAEPEPCPQSPVNKKAKSQKRSLCKREPSGGKEPSADSASGKRPAATSNCDRLGKRNGAIHTAPLSTAAHAAVQSQPLQPGEHLEVQQTRCRTNRYSELERCRACVQNRNEQCRFRFNRLVAVANDKDGYAKLRSLHTFVDGDGFKCNVVPDTQQLTAETRAEARYILRNILPVLMEVEAEESRLEERHTQLGPATLVNSKDRALPTKKTYLPQGYSQDGGERQECDKCATTVYQRYAICSQCGCELCLRCYDDLVARGVQALGSRTGICTHAPSTWRLMVRVRPDLVSGMLKGASKLAKGTTQANPSAKMMLPAPKRTPPSLDLPSQRTRARRSGAAEGTAVGQGGVQAGVRESNPVADQLAMSQSDAGNSTAPQVDEKMAAPSPSQTQDMRGPSQTESTTKSSEILRTTPEATSTSPTAPSTAQFAITSASTTTREVLRLPSWEGTQQAKKFVEAWQAGEPVLVAGVDKELQERWDPDQLVELFGNENVQLMDTATGLTKWCQLQDFFLGFRYPKRRPVIPVPPASRGKDSKLGPPPPAPPAPPQGSSPLLKLKDWPPKADFKDLLPKHFQDIMQALPFPKYTQRTGAFNLANQLPTYTLPPDLGQTH